MNYFATLLRRGTRRRTYANLLALDDHLLRDIGLSRGDVHEMIHGRSTARRIGTHE